MKTIEERAEYLLHLMPRLRKGIESRISAPKPAFGRELTFGQLEILELLFRLGPQTVGAAARQFRVALSTMTESLDRVEKAGYVERVRDGQDRRVVTIRLTATGRRMLERWNRHALETTVALLKSLGVAEQRAMIKVFQTLETILLK